MSKITVVRSKRNDNILRINCTCHNASYRSLKQLREDHPTILESDIEEILR